VLSLPAAPASFGSVGRILSGGVAQAAVKKKISPKRHGARGRKKGHVMLERHVVATKGGLPNVQALGSLVVDETGREIFSRNPDKERPIASISKLAATLVVAERGIELDGLTTIEKGDVEVAKGGARSRLLAGMTLSNRDLLHAALMGSDNRAIPALGRAVKLSPSQLTTAMNGKMRELGLKSTRFHEPTGLSPNNVSTPRETIKLLRAAMANPLLASITERVEYEAHPVGKPPLKYINTDHVAARGNIQVLGGKTGYNDVARYCLVIATKVDGRTYYMAFLANEGKLTRFGDVARVADWVIVHKPKSTTAPGTAVAANPSPIPTTTPPATTGPAAAPAAAPAEDTFNATAVALPVGVAAPPPAATEPPPPATATP
jgi:D-alanyl-D-alanine endopeptidase (penicillin-binding protein 7)